MIWGMSTGTGSKPPPTPQYRSCSACLVSWVGNKKSLCWVCGGPADEKTQFYGSGILHVMPQNEPYENILDEVREAMDARR